MQGLNSLKLKRKDGTLFNINQNIEENDILLFLDSTFKRSEILTFMEALLEDKNMLAIFSNHRDYFYSKPFEHRAVIVLKDKINNEALKMLERFYNSKISTDLPSYLDQMKDTFSLIFAAALKSIANLPNNILKGIKKSSLSKIREMILNNMFNLDLTEKDKKEIEKELKNFYAENIDLYSFVFLFPFSSIELIKESKILEVKESIINELKKMNIIFPLISIYLCDNARIHDYNANPPFVSILLPHIEAFDRLNCPKCGKPLKSVKYFGFIPEISKRIMSNNGFFPYIFAYLLKKKEISFACNIKTTKANETDFIITAKNNQIYIEVKCCNKDLNTNTRQGMNKVATNIINAIDQMENNIKIWESHENITFSKKILLINYSKNQIENSLDIKNLETKIKNSKIEVFGFDEFEEILTLLNS